MTRLKTCLASATLLLGASALPVWAVSSTASSASDSVTGSVGSVSGSIERSSNSSSDNKTVADGDYKILEVATLAERPNMVRLTLQAVAGPAADGADKDFFLYVPRTVAADSALAPGGIVSARQRAYGIEFAQGPQRQAFFLVLSDTWYRELQTSPVVL
jgi:hypothetical protein